MRTFGNSSRPITSGIGWNFERATTQLSLVQLNKVMLKLIIKLTIACM